MKTITIPTKGVDCRCGKASFMVELPQGGDYTTCPLCQNMCDSEIGEMFDTVNTIQYCEDCGILFERGCTHASNGCTDDTCWAQLIKGYTVPKLTYVKEKGPTIVYKYVVGMPIFDSFEECVRLSATLTYEWVCMCYLNITTCERAVYPESKYPEYYAINKNCINNKV